jgi:hypothetical protein
MKASALKYNVLTFLAGSITAIIMLVPFHAFLTVWAASNFGHYTAFRLWKEALLLVLIAGALALIAMDQKIRSETMTRRLVWLVIAYAFVQLFWGLIAFSGHSVTFKALGYGLISNLRFPAFFLVTWAVASRTTKLEKNWDKRVLYPAAVVVLFGLLQIFVLPRDFLGHFGYSDATISPFETINHNVNYVRIASTLRGANPLGTYLIIPISLLAVIINRNKARWQPTALLVAALVVLFFSYSRGAYIGAFLSLAIIEGQRFKQVLLKPKSLVVIGAASLLLIVGAAVAVHGNSRIQNILTHTEDHSVVKTTSNQGHIKATIAGIKDVALHPLGRGTGTSGPASVYNHNARIPENYFLQIGEETGWIGLALFGLINVGVGYLLWLRRAQPLALALFASLIGLTFVNLLSHAWADDTLAYVWWGLAGMAMVTPRKHAR